MIQSLLKKLLQFPTQLFLVVIGALLFLPGLGSVHLFDWDEINFAESAREMLLTGNWRMVQINFEQFYEKPPFFIWLQAYSMQHYGVNEFAARLPNAICGIITLLVVFNAGRSVFKSQMGVLWALMFACSMLPHLYFKSGIIDPFFNLFIFLGIFFMFKTSVINDFEPGKQARQNRRYSMLLSGLFIGLATLTKGPVAILLAVLTAIVYLVANRGKLKLELGQILTWWLVIGAIILTWLSFEVKANGTKFIEEFIAYHIRLFKTQDAGHGGPVWYHWVVLLVGVFPASAFMFDAFRKNAHDDTTQINLKKWMIYLLGVVLVVFSVVQTKIIHYSSLAYFPITFLAAYYLNHLFDKHTGWTWRQTVPLVTLGLLIVGAVTVGILVMQKPGVFINYIKDDFAVANLQAKVYWTRNDIFFGAIYLVCLLVAILLVQTRHLKWGTYLLIISSAVFVNSMMTLIVPRVEKYSQAALIEFLESKQQEDCLIETAGFKSYAHYFYARKPIPHPGHTPKHHYVITKVNKAAEVMTWNNRLHELYRKNGWVFLEIRPE